MKKAIVFFLVILSSNSFAYSVVDSMYLSPKSDIQRTRLPASNEGSYCLMTEDNNTFANLCYSSIETCNKRLEFWKDLAGAKKHYCVKL